MDTFCGLGLPELIVIVLVGFVVIGPQRSRELAVVAGRLIKRAMRSAWWREFSQVTNSLRDLPNTLVRMAELEDDLRKVRADLSQAAQLDNIGPVAGRADKANGIDVELDPWGVGLSDKPTNVVEEDAAAPDDQLKP